MKPKYFYPNENGDITFTREELEKLLNDVYDEGREDGLKASNPWYVSYITPYTPTYYNSTTTPDYNPTIYCTDDNSIGRIVLDIEKL